MVNTSKTEYFIATVNNPTQPANGSRSVFDNLDAAVRSLMSKGADFIKFKLVKTVSTFEEHKMSDEDTTKMKIFGHVNEYLKTSGFVVPYYSHTLKELVPRYCFDLYVEYLARNQTKNKNKRKYEYISVYIKQSDVPKKHQKQYGWSVYAGIQRAYKALDQHYPEIKFLCKDTEYTIMAHPDAASIVQFKIAFDMDPPNIHLHDLFDYVDNKMKEDA